jgi:glutamate-5-semialdehyde dehydrogenase
MSEIEKMLSGLRDASIRLASAPSDLKNSALEAIAHSLHRGSDEIIAANKLDLERSEAESLAAPLLKRLKLDSGKIEGLISGISSLVNLPDPVGAQLSATKLDDGLVLRKVSVPIGVIGVIFESRPDALVQIATLGLKSGNCVVLKGGSEAKETNRILARLITEAITSVDEVFDDTIGLLETREDVASMLEYDNYINLIIPRGSNEFVKYIQDNSSIPVMGHADGICHGYIDSEADIEVAIPVIVDSKTQYVAVCNALETLLVHEGIAQQVLPDLAAALKDKNVLIKGCAKTMQILPGIEPATEEDWKTEYLDYTVSIKIVDSLDEAINHINRYGSGHTDVIITRDRAAASKFQALVDSSSVMVNCSTRFADGFRYGFGAEVGISTNKIHARGPVGLDGLVIYKFLVDGEGHIVENYSGPDARAFKHEKM